MPVPNLNCDILLAAVDDRSGGVGVGSTKVNELPPEVEFGRSRGAGFRPKGSDLHAGEWLYFHTLPDRNEPAPAALAVRFSIPASSRSSA